MEDEGEGDPLVAMVMDVCACDERKAARALALAGHDPNTAIELVLSGHPRLAGGGEARRDLSPPRLPGGGSMGGGGDGGGSGDDAGGDEDVVEMIQWGLSESAAKYALLHNNFNRQQAVEWWFTVPEGEQLRDSFRGRHAVREGRRARAVAQVHRRAAFDEEADHGPATVPARQV